MAADQLGIILIHVTWIIRWKNFPVELLLPTNNLRKNRWQMKATARLQSQHNFQTSSDLQGDNCCFCVSSANHYLLIHSCYSMVSQLQVPTFSMSTLGADVLMTTRCFLLCFSLKMFRSSDRFDYYFNKHQRRRGCCGWKIPGQPKFFHLRDSL